MQIGKLWKIIKFCVAQEKIISNCSPKMEKILAYAYSQAIGEHPKSIEEYDKEIHINAEFNKVSDETMKMVMADVNQSILAYKHLSLILEDEK